MSYSLLDDPFARCYGPLTLIEWVNMAEMVKAKTGDPNKFPDEFVRLVTFHAVPLPEALEALDATGGQTPSEWSPEAHGKWMSARRRAELSIEDREARSRQNQSRA